MTTQTFYSWLQENTNNFNSSILDAGKLNKMKNDLEIELLAENNKNTTTKERIKKIDSHFNQSYFERKPILKCFKWVNGYKTFTDSYFITCLTENDGAGLTLKNEADANVGIYPDVSKIIENVNNNLMYGLEKIAIKYDDLKNKLKLVKKDGIIALTTNNNNIVTFGKIELSIFLITLNLKNSDEIVLFADSHHLNGLWACKNNNTGSFGGILPTRH